ncbi:hypothetical protein, partial [Salipaludibacillus sp. CF4.18]|uniref:hypothetical protein n=1 Tax=Salipaludibacillus sp. CF4.18 TaxID=3373081 RepID=UPI003EE48027
MLVHSATQASEVGLFDVEKQHMVYGYGVSNLARVLESNNKIVTLYTEDNLDLDNFHIYEIPIPNDFNNVVGDKQITVTLGFNPPVRHTRKDYLGTKMSFRLVRDKNGQEVVEHFRTRKKEEGSPEKLGRYNCKMDPGSTIRGKGTVQKASLYSKTKTRLWNTFYLVVRNESVWASEEF